MKRILNKWQMHWSFGKDPRTMERGWRRIEFAIVNIREFPPEGYKLTRDLYDGFIIKFCAWLPFDSAD